MNNNNVVNSGYSNGWDQGQQSSVVNNNNVVNGGNGGYNSASPYLGDMLLPGDVLPNLWGVLLLLTCGVRHAVLQMGSQCQLPICGGLLVADMWCAMLCCRRAVSVNCQFVGGCLLTCGAPCCAADGQSVSIANNNNQVSGGYQNTPVSIANNNNQVGNSGGEQSIPACVY